MPLLLGAAVHRFAAGWLRTRIAELRPNGRFDEMGLSMMADLAEYHETGAELAEEGDHNFSIGPRCSLQDRRGSTTATSG